MYFPLYLVLTLCNKYVSGLRFGQEINIIIKCREYRKILRIVICKFTDLVMFWVLDF